MQADPTAPILAADHLIKRFGSVVALKGVSFDLRPGEVHALCGENGAGKSTLIKLLGGIHPAGSYEGTVRVDGNQAAFAGPKDAEHAGVSVIYQELALVPEMTVAENIFLGTEPRRFGGLAVDWPKVYQQAGELLGRFGLDLRPDARIADLGIGHRQLVEIAKALSKNSRVLILDEPTAALTETEVDVLLDILRDLRRRGIAMVYISHKLDEVFAIADRITVLRDGASVATFDAKEATRHDVIRLMVGRELNDLFPRRASHPGEVLLSVKDLTVLPTGNAAPTSPSGELLADIALDLRAGEVLGIGGLMGAGRTELLMHLMGALGRRTKGTVTLAGQPLTPADTADRVIAKGMALVSEDRKRYGLVLDRPIGFNLSLSSLKTVAGGRTLGWIDESAERKRGQELFGAMRVKAGGLDTVVGTLSGGNQQKVVIGKALLSSPKVVLLDEPTRGIDVGAKLEVYELINKLTDEGRGVILVSSELPELMGMSDRILMLSQGRITGSFTRDTATQENLMAAAMGHATA